MDSSDVTVPATSQALNPQAPNDPTQQAPMEVDNASQNSDKSSDSTASGKRAMTAAEIDQEQKEKDAKDAESRKKARVEQDQDARKKELEEKTAKMVRFQKALMGKVPMKNAQGEEVVVQGILREKTRKENGHHPIIPFEHQKSVCKRALQESVPRLLVCHDPGLGKTFSFLLMVAGMHVVDIGKMRKTVISAPASCLDQWLRACLDSLRIPEERILRTNQLAKLTFKNIRKHDVFIISRDTLRRAYLECHEWVVKHHLSESRHWMSQWDRKRVTPDGPFVPMHPIFTNIDMFCIDEVHFLRNPTAAWTKGHELLSSLSRKTIGMTATPVFNKPQDLMGISIAMDLKPVFKEVRSWFRDKAKTIVNLNTVREFNKLTDRVSDDILNLPPITDEYRDFDARIDPVYVRAYNSALMSARKMRISIERRGKATSEDLRKLMAMIQTLQQFVVSPMLAEQSAAVVRDDPELIKKAAEQETGSLVCLKDTIRDLNSQGYNHVLVACCHVAPIKVAEHYLSSKAPDIGTLVLYTGSLCLKKRDEATNAFLKGDKAVMIMSIEAGGTGLHLVGRPSFPTAVVFWGSRPFSPMQIIQTRKRVHRIGQECPVKVVHLIADGSVDSAINFIHGDKLTLAKAVVDNETSKLEEAGGAWRTPGRIVDRCRLLTRNGQFAEVGADETQVLEETYSGDEEEEEGEEQEEEEDEEEEDDDDDEEEEKEIKAQYDQDNAPKLLSDEEKEQLIAAGKFGCKSSAAVWEELVDKIKERLGGYPDNWFELVIQGSLFFGTGGSSSSGNAIKSEPEPEPDAEPATKTEPEDDDNVDEEDLFGSDDEEEKVDETKTEASGLLARASEMAGSDSALPEL